MLDQIFEIINFALKKIDTERDWRPFLDLVLNVDAHAGQLEFLEKSTKRENGLHPGNGFGKTKILAAKHLYYILKHFTDCERYKTLNIAITSEQSELVQDAIEQTIKGAPILRSWLINKNSITKFPSPKIKYTNGAVSEFKTTKRKGEAVEGKEYGYISADEIALELNLEFIRDKILLPRLRAWADSQIDFSATPKGLNAYYRVMNDIKRKGGYVRGGSSYENPFIDHALLDYQKTTWSQAKIEQIIEGKFIDNATMMFASRVEKLFDNNLSFIEVDKGHKYIEGWDLARGRKGSISDQTVGLRIDITLRPHQITKYWAFQMPWTEQERTNIKKDLGTKAPQTSIEREIRQAQYESGADVVLDSTGVGDTLYGILMDIAKPIDFRGGNKDLILDHLQAVLDTEIIKAPYLPQLADEMTTYQRDDKLLDTDFLMALAIACQKIQIKEMPKFGTRCG